MSARGRIVLGAGLVRRPWPNGRGMTRDVAGEEAADGRPSWLLSLADLSQDAPFSHFPEADRVFTLIEGGSLELAIDGLTPIRCDPLVPVHFPGDRPTESRLLGGPGRAFNVFVDRRDRTARVQALRLAGGHRAAESGEIVVAFCVAGALQAADGQVIGPGDTWLGGGLSTFRAAAPAALILAAIDRREKAIAS